MSDKLLSFQDGAANAIEADPPPQARSKLARLGRVLGQPFCIVAQALFVMFVGVYALSRPYTPDAALFPTLVGVFGAFLCIAFIAACFLEPDYLAANARDMEKAEGRADQFWIAFLASPLYCCAIYLVGFHISTFIALISMPYLLGYRRPLRLILLALAALAFAQVVFVQAVQIDLPNGLLGDFLLQRFFYES